MYRGQIIDRLTGRIVYESRTCTTWEDAQHRAERACTRRYGKGNARYAVRVA